MDIQKLIDSMNELGRRTRSNYHLTLGELIEILRQAPTDAPVLFEHGKSVGDEMSYRGYYNDLSFEAQDEEKTAAQVLAQCERAKTETYTGYKGGDYTYGDDTPLWTAPYGCCGLAIIGAEIRDGAVMLATKQVD